MSRAPTFALPLRASRPGQRLSAADIVACVTAELAAARLPAGARLPPVRALEREHGLSKNTAQAAYDELAARGLVEPREREGFFVAAPDAPAAATPAGATPPAPALRPAPRLFTTRPPHDALALSTVLVDPDLLPRDRITDCLRSVLRTPGLKPLYDFQGHPGLRACIAERLRRRGMEVTPEQVVTTVGSQQALDIVGRALEVRRIAVENPVYPHARLLFQNQGAALEPLPLDPFGSIDLERWEERWAESRPALAYLITSFQNPTGYSYTTHELAGIARLAERHGVALMEDDWGSDMLSEGEYRPTLRALAGANVIYVNSFTKKLWPSLRIGFLVAPAALVPALVAQKRLSTLGTPWLLEAAAAELIERGYYDTHLRALQEALDARYAHTLDLLRALMPDDARWTTPGGGPTLWLDLPRRIDLPALAAALLRRAVYIEDTRAAFFGEPHLHGFRVSYAYLKEDDMRRALTAVAEELRRFPP